MLELITLVLAILVIAMTVHASILSSPNKQRKWFLVYGVGALVLLIWQAGLIHKDNTTKGEQEAGLKSQIALLVNTAKLQASVDDVHAIQKSIELGFERLAGRLPGRVIQPPKPKSALEPPPPESTTFALSSDPPFPTNLMRPMAPKSSFKQTWRSSLSPSGWTVMHP